MSQVIDALIYRVVVRVYCPSSPNGEEAYFCLCSRQEKKRLSLLVAWLQKKARSAWRRELAGFQLFLNLPEVSESVYRCDDFTELLWVLFDRSGYVEAKKPGGVYDRLNPRLTDEEVRCYLWLNRERPDRQVRDPRELKRNFDCLEFEALLRMVKPVLVEELVLV